MNLDAPQTLLIATISAFVIGWLVAKVSAYFGNRIAEKQRDPRDASIRSLEAELRIARTELEKTRTALAEREQELVDVARQLENAELHRQKQDEIIQSLRNDLRESVRKTRELRSELTNRATENLKSEVKLREVETELSVAQASTDLIATGVLDYSEAPDPDEACRPKVRQPVR